MLVGERKYSNTKKFQLIELDTESITTECTSISFQNVGDIKAFLVCDGVALDLDVNNAINHSNQPDVIETTFYERIIFDPTGTGAKKVLITREYINIIKY